MSMRWQLGFTKLCAASPGAGRRSRATMNGQLGDLGTVGDAHALHSFACGRVLPSSSSVRVRRSHRWRRLLWPAVVRAADCEQLHRQQSVHGRARSHGFVLSLVETQSTGLRRPGAQRALFQAPQSLAGRQGARELGNQDAALASKILPPPPSRPQQSSENVEAGILLIICVRGISSRSGLFSF